MNEKLKLTEKIGVFSGNRYIKEIEGDERLLEERDLDTPDMFEMWFNEIKPDEDFQEEIVEIVKKWKNLIPEELDASKFTIHLLGQSHIDMAWKWRYRQTRRKGIKTMEKVLRHTSMFPDSFRYALSQPCLIDWIKQDDPQLYSKILDLFKTENIELVGGSWVEPDCMMPSGEAFVRQRLYGMMFYQKEFGKLPEVEWYLDSFGYNIGLPQILSKSGCKYLWTNKMTWNVQTTFPFVYYNWQSPSGDSIVTAAFEQQKAAFEKWEKYIDGRYALKENSKREWTYEDDYSELSQHVDRTQMVTAIGLFEGKGDGGHGPTHQEVAEMDEYVKASPKAGLNIRWSTAQEFFEEVASFKENLPIWKDEMYLEYHRGCFSVHSETKRHNRRLENLLTSAEKIATMTAIFNPDYSYPKNKIQNAWKDVLLNQFHDVLPGSSCPEVYDDTFDIWVNTTQIIHTIIDECLAFTKNIKNTAESNVSLYNPLPWKRSHRVFIPLDILNENNSKVRLDENGKPPYALLKIDGEMQEETLICQPVAAEFKDNMFNLPAGWWTTVSNPSLGIIEGKLELGEKIGTDLFIQKTPEPIMNNGRISVKLSAETGAIVEVKSSEINNGNNLVYGDKSFHVVGYNDLAKTYPAWNIQEEYWKYPKNYDQSKDLKIEIEDHGPIFITLSITKLLQARKQEDKSSIPSAITQKISLFRDDPIIYCSWQSNWNEKNTMLKIVMDTNTKADKVSVDEQYCALTMSTLPKTPADKARYEKIMQKYADLSTKDNKWGMALLNEGKYAFDASEGRIRLTLHRSPIYPSPPAESWLNFERELNEKEYTHKVPTHSGIGPISCRFGYYFHPGGTFKNANGQPSNMVKRATESFNNPVIARKIENKSNSGIKPPKFDVYVPENVELSVIKQKEWEDSKSLILRFSEICGVVQTKANVIFPEEYGKLIKKIVPVDLLERSIDAKFEWNSEDNELKFELGKFEIKSFEIILK